MKKEPVVGGPETGNSKTRTFRIARRFRFPYTGFDVQIHEEIVRIQNGRPGPPGGLRFPGAVVGAVPARN